MGDHIKLNWSIILWLLFLLFPFEKYIWAQYDAKQLQRDQTAPLELLEIELSEVAQDILYHPSIEHKRELNRHFIKRMKVILSRMDSYNYNFSKLTTISRLFPEDQTFRIFTWTILDRDQLNTYSNSTYYGIVQRKFINSKTQQASLYITELNDHVNWGRELENHLLGPENWLGALYYHPKNSDFGVLTFEGKHTLVDGISGKKKKVNINYYVLLGLNAHDISSNYKIIDVITFDPLEPSKVSFGAPIFFIHSIPKTRHVIRYSDNSPFSLNYGKVVTNDFSLFKTYKNMLIFDHMDTPAFDTPKDKNQIGADGTYDAYFFSNRIVDGRKGLFLMARNVEVHNPVMEHYKQKEIKKQIKKEKRRIRRMMR